MSGTLPTRSETLPEAQTVRFYPKRGLGYKHEKDHLALSGADVTLCGLAVNRRGSSGTHVTAGFDPEMPFSCKRCLAALRKHGPVRVFSRISFWDDGHWSVVE